MAEIRTTSSTGGQKGVKPERFSLMPRKGLEAIARVFGFGAEKYESHNWRRGYEWSKSFDALERHIQAAKDGETFDEESGLPHLAHAGFHVLVLLTWLEEQGEGVDNPFDDRWPAAMERFRRAREAGEKVDISGIFPVEDYLPGMRTVQSRQPNAHYTVATDGVITRNEIGIEDLRM